MVQSLSPWIGFPMLGCALAWTAYGYMDAIIDALPIFRHLRSRRVPLGAVVRRAAFYTEWALSYQPTPPRSADLESHILSPLIIGKIHATGKQHEPGKIAPTAAMEIPISFWASAVIDIEYHLIRAGGAAAYGSGDMPVVCCSEITFDSRDVNRVWPYVPKRKRRGRVSVFVALAQELYNQRNLVTGMG